MTENNYQKGEQKIEQEFQKIEKEIETKLKPLSVKEILEMVFQEKQFWVENLIPQKSICVISGYPESGKSWLLLELARSVASGTLFLERFQTQQGSVLLVDEETGFQEMQRRMQLLSFDPNLPIYFLSQENLKVDNEENLEFLLNKVRENGIRLIIFDPFSTIHSKRENEAQEMQRVMECLQKFVLEGTTVIFAHHHRKEWGWFKSTPSQSLRGSSLLFGRVDSHIAIERKEESSKINLIVTHEKLRNGKKIQPFQVSLEEENGFIKLVYLGRYEEEKTKIEQVKGLIRKILESGETFTKEELWEKVTNSIEVSRRTFDKAFAELRKSEEIKPVDKKEITKPSGRKQRVSLFGLFSNGEEIS